MSGSHSHFHAHAHAHAHAHGDGEAFGDPTIARILRYVVIAIGVAVVVGIAVLWPSGGRTADPLGLASDPIDAHVIAVEEQPCNVDATQTCNLIGFEIRSGDRDGTQGFMELGEQNTIGAGDDIQVIAVETQDGGVTYTFYEFQRRTPLLLLVGLFAVAIIALGRWRGLGALAGLAVSLFVIIWFSLPAIVDGNNAVLVALITAGAVAIVALYLAHGPGPATDVALLSTLASLALTALLAWLFVRAAKLTGFTDDASFVLDAIGDGIDARGILLAGIVIGSLGVLDDVTVTQVSAVRELRLNAPDAPRAELFRRALTIGRDHISSTVNTLFLAYAGAALPLLLLFSGIGESVSGVATREIVAVEIVRALVGSLGLVASVPISTWLAVEVLSRGRAPES